MTRESFRGGRRLLLVLPGGDTSVAGKECHDDRIRCTYKLKNERHVCLNASLLQEVAYCISRYSFCGLSPSAVTTVIYRPECFVPLSGYS